MIQLHRSLRRSTFVAVGCAAVVLLCTPAGLSAASDGGPGEVRLLVRFDHLPRVGKRLTFAGGEAAVRHELRDVSALAVELPQSQVEALRRMPGVLAVEPDLERHIYGSLDSVELVPSLSNGLYGLVTTKVTAVQKRRVTGVGATVCVADTGLDIGHPDIAPAYAGGLDTVDNDDDPDLGPGDHGDGNHGTHVAGILIAALNGSGVRGVAYGARLYHARVLNDRGRGNSSDIMEGVRRLVDDFGCRVVSMSLGGTDNSETEAEFYRGIADRGVLVVAAAGNESAAAVSFPAAYEGVLAVGAVDSKNRHASFSNIGSALDISAPGVAVLSSVPRGSGEEAWVKTGKSYGAIGMEFAAHTGGTTALLIDCGNGNSAEQFPGKVAGNVALVRRGEANFSIKVENAMNAGAIAAVVYNNVAGDFAGTLGAEQASDGRDWIPAVGVSDATGAILRRSLNKKITVVDAPTSWASYTGTSMATPIVAGVATLLLGVKPSLGATDLTAILERTAIRLGSRGYNQVYGWGLVNADAAVRAAQGR